MAKKTTVFFSVVGALTLISAGIAYLNTRKRGMAKVVMDFNKNVKTEEIPELELIKKEAEKIVEEMHTIVAAEEPKCKLNIINIVNVGMTPHYESEWNISIEGNMDVYGQISPAVDYIKENKDGDVYIMRKNDTIIIRLRTWYDKDEEDLRKEVAQCETLTDIVKLHTIINYD